MEGRKRAFPACRSARAGDCFIWGGDFNAGIIQLTALVQNIDEGYAACQVSIDSGAAQPGSLQLVFSHPMRFKHGDLAMARGLRSVQTNSEIGAFFDG
eukprot:2310801-Pyramimonas_sp.AAC.1